MNEILRFFLIVVIVATTIAAGVIVLLIPTTMMEGHIESIKCNNVEKQGFNVKLEDKLMFDKSCFVEVNNRYVPYSRWISLEK